MRPLSNFKSRDVEALLHPTTNLFTHKTAGPLVLERGEGIYVVDSDGKRYIEGLAGLWCTALGYGNQELIETAKEQMGKLSFTHLFGGRSHEPAIELAEKIKAIAPCPTSKVFFTASGSETNDSQIKLAWYYNNARGKPNKKKIICRVKALSRRHHRLGLPDRPACLPRRLRPADGWRHAHRHPALLEGRRARRKRGRLCHPPRQVARGHDPREGPETIAAFIAEPVMGAGGVIVPPTGYFEKVSALLRKHDIAFIADEVICGFGRTGNWLGSQTYNASPTTDLHGQSHHLRLLPARCADGARRGLPDARLDASQKHGVFAHGFTYSGHPVGSAIACKTIEIYQRIDIVGHVRKVATTFQGRLHEARGPSPGRRSPRRRPDRRPRTGQG